MIPLEHQVILHRYSIVAMEEQEESMLGWISHPSHAALENTQSYPSSYSDDVISIPPSWTDHPPPRPVKPDYLYLNLGRLCLVLCPWPLENHHVLDASVLAMPLHSVVAWSALLIPVVLPPTRQRR